MSLITEVVKHVWRVHATVASDHNLTDLLAWALLPLQECGSVPIRELATHLGNDPSTMTTFVDRLEIRCILSRIGDPADRRVRRLVLTPIGEAAVNDIVGNLNLASPNGSLDDDSLKEQIRLLSDMSIARSP